MRLQVGAVARYVAGAAISAGAAIAICAGAVGVARAVGVAGVARGKQKYRYQSGKEKEEKGQNQSGPWPALVRFGRAMNPAGQCLGIPA